MTALATRRGTGAGLTVHDSGTELTVRDCSDGGGGTELLRYVYRPDTAGWSPEAASAPGADPLRPPGQPVPALGPRLAGGSPGERPYQAFPFLGVTSQSQLREAGERER
ncbi:hypothetical protein ACFSKW_18205 [Nonomuraea mangrovi]|uniref:Uncharacterized protein n=1 Tax=Nonomuraea mangrovi TaxID=2316207 RepID=A0ABW4SX19_9ACTN